MNELTTEAFVVLFKEAYRKCFGFPLENPMSETESKHFANKIFEETGLVIGAKSIKNYSLFVLDNADSKPENPSVPTLDTLARYVLSAPYTDEVKRKENEGHYPYWFEYKSKLNVSSRMSNDRIRKQKINNRTILLIILVFVVVFFLWTMFSEKSTGYFADDFQSTNQDSFFQKGWFVKSVDENWWAQRNALPSHLTLYTLRGDNWADSANAPSIKNLLLRKISSECFTTEIHFDNFIPLRNWQQAGILLMEDSNIKSRSVRLSLAYNDFFGGYNKPGQVLIQCITSNANDLSKPEEIAHFPIYDIDTPKENLMMGNFRKSALKIEKNGNHFRFLYAVGLMENAAFKEVASKDLSIHPKYLGLFAFKGFVADTTVASVNIKFFSISNMTCDLR